MSIYNDLEDSCEYIISVEDENGQVNRHIAIAYDVSDGIEGADRFTPALYRFAFGFYWVSDREFECDWIEVDSPNLKSWERVRPQPRRVVAEPLFINFQK